MTPQLQACPDINVPWNELIAAAQEMELRSAASRGYLADAASAWTGLKDAYRQPDTETEVHTALEELGEPMQQWQRSLSQAKEAIAGFVAAGKPLQAESEELAAAKLGLVAELVRAERSSDADDDDADRTAARAAAFNNRAERLRTQWQALAEETIAALQGIKGGTAEFLPPGALLGALALPAPAWAGFTSGLDEAFGVLSPTDNLPSLRGLTTEELRAWAQANPEGAALLAGNTLPVWRMPGSAEAVMAKAMEGGNPLTADGIAGIRSAWLGLSPADQERLLLLFPAVFGNLNGVPFRSRARANTITVAGYQETVSSQRESLRPEPELRDYLVTGTGQPSHARSDYQLAYRQYSADLAAWTADRNRLENLGAGLGYAFENNVQIVMISLEGDGRVVAMNGVPGPDTQTVSTVVPGTGANLGLLEGYMKKVDAIDGDSRSGAVSFYWQGTDLPDEVTDNVTTSYNEQGGPMLAAFDHALDLETTSDPRSTYVGYSAGGSLLGTAEREGLNSTNIVYVAPAGTGHNVGSPEDTANPDANRYWLQTRDDPIEAAQLLGGGYHGPSFWAGGSPRAMDPVRLETGFLIVDDPGSLIRGHVDYFWPDSTSALNIQGVIEGTNVMPYIEDEIINTYSPFGPVVTSPIEEDPEDYAYDNLETVTVESLEK